MEEKKKYKHSTASPAHTKAAIKYNKACTVQYPFRLNIKTDEDIIKRLSEVPSMAGYIKQLIRADIEKNPTDEDGVFFFTSVRFSE